MSRVDKILNRNDRALELQQIGVSTDAIAERLGFNSAAQVREAISRAKARREKAGEVVA